METVAASIIVPVYKAESFLRKCLDSIQAQTYTDFECILIDDGSPDRSGEICEEYAARDPRFRVFHQENIGVTRTREIGVEKARGKYIFWCDADDYADEKLLGKALSELERSGADIVHFGTQDFREGEVKPPDICLADCVEDIRKEVILGDNNAAVLWNFAVKREFWLGEHAPMEVARSAADGYMAIRLHEKAKKISVLHDVLYYHLFDSPYSISHTFTGKRYMGNFFLWNYRRQMCEKSFPELERHCAARVLSNGVKAFCLSLLLKDLTEAEQDEIKTALKEVSRKPISGRQRDKFLKWCILNGHFGVCRVYAGHKLSKAKKKNERMSKRG